MSEHKGSSAGTGRGGAQRDLIVISSAALALLLIGVAFDLFDRTHRWLAARLPFPVDNLLAVLVILSGAFCAFGIRQWVQADRERGLRARSDERYQAAENRYRTIVERVPAVSYTWDAADEPGTSSALYISPQIERLLGYTPDEWRADPSLWDRCAHPEDREHALRAWAEATTAGQAFALEYRMNTRDGRSIWVRDEAVPIAPGRRGLPVYQGVMIDITEQKRAEEQYRTLIEHLPATVYIDAVDDLSTARYISPQYETLTGYTPSERLATPDLWVRMLHPDDREAVLAESQRTNETGEPFNIEYRIITKSGETVWVHDHASLVDGPDGTRAWQGVLTDITERQLAREGLSRRDRILEAVGLAAELFLGASSWTEALPDVLDHIGVVGEASRTAVYRTEWDERGRPCVALVHEWTAPGVQGFTEVMEGRSVALEDAGLARWAEAFRAGEAVHGRVSDLPEDERRILESSGVRAIVAIPIVASGSWWGHLVYDQAEEERVWQPAELDALRIVANTLGAAIGRETAAHRLSEAEARHRRLVEQIPAVTYTWTWRGDRYFVTYASPQIETILGYTREEWIADPTAWYRWVHPDDRASVIAENRRCERTGEPFSMLYRMSRKDGRVIWVEDAWVVVDQDDDHGSFQGLVFDVTARKEAEDRLQAAQERYRLLVEQIPAITYVDVVPESDDGGTWPTVYISPQVEEVLGYTADEWTATPGLWSSLIHPDDRERVAEADRHHYETGEPLAIEVRVTSKDGAIRWLRDEAIMVRDADGKSRWSQGLLLDITEAKIAEQQLHEAEERYRSLIESLPAATYIDTVDAISQAIYMSPQVEKIYGYTPEEWKTQPWLWEQGLHPDDHDTVVAAAEQLNAEGVPYEVEYRFRHRDGHWVWVHDQCSIIRDEHGVPRVAQGVVFDVTERREAEEQLREAEERFRAMVEHVPSAVYLDRPDLSLQTEYVSPQIEDILGYTPEEWVAEPELWTRAVHPDDRDEVLRTYSLAVEAGEPWSAEYRMRTRDGRNIWVRDETTFLHDENGEHVFMQGVLSDITERRLAEQALRESEQREREAAERLRALDEMKNTFLAAVSHELRSPLTSILGLALTLERSEMPAEDRNDLLERLASNARKLDRLLKDLLDIDRLNRGMIEPQYRVTDVGALARRTVDNLDALADRTILVQADSVVLAVDPAKVERIVENLLMNAARHTTIDSTIWLRVESSDEGVFIAVEDDGPGVPPEMTEAIFEPFRQGPNPTPHAPGTGIGLSLVSRFASLHGGRAWVEERDGGGASFRVVLPAGPVDGPAAARVIATAGAAMKDRAPDTPSG